MQPCFWVTILVGRGRSGVFHVALPTTESLVSLAREPVWDSASTAMTRSSPRDISSRCGPTWGKASLLTHHGDPHVTMEPQEPC